MDIQRSAQEIQQISDHRPDGIQEDIIHIAAPGHRDQLDQLHDRRQHTAAGDDEPPALQSGRHEDRQKCPERHECGDISENVDCKQDPHRSPKREIPPDLPKRNQIIPDLMAARTPHGFGEKQKIDHHNNI